MGPQNKGVGCVSIRRLLLCRIQGDSKSGADIQGECNERLSASSGRKHLDFASAAPQNHSNLTPNLHESTLRLASLAQCKLRSEVKYPELVEGQQNIWVGLYTLLPQEQEDITLVSLMTRKSGSASTMRASGRVWRDNRAHSLLSIYRLHFQTSQKCESERFNSRAGQWRKNRS